MTGSIASLAMTDRGLITISSQGRVAAAAASAMMSTQGRMQGSGITTAASAAIDRLYGLRGISGHGLLGPSPSGGPEGENSFSSGNGGQHQQQEQDVKSEGICAIITSREASMAAACQIVAANGFVPIDGVFEMDRW